MTKQEYMDKLNAAWFSGARCGKLEAATEIKDKYIASLEAENANLRADNRSLVDQMNQMALKPNQEVIEWHSYPEEKPELSRCCIVERKNFCYHIAHHNEIDGWLDSVTFDVLSEVKSWAYLPKGVTNE